MYEKDIIFGEYDCADTVNLYSDFTANIGLLGCERYILQRYASSDSGILDACCAAGRTTIGAYKSGFTNIMGVDICESMIKAAVSNSEQAGAAIDFRCCDILKFDEKGFNLITFWFNSLMVIPSVQYRRSIIRHCISCLDKDGIIVITAPLFPEEYDFGYESENYSRTKFRFAFEYGDRVFDGRYYIHFPTDSEIEEYCAGMTLLESDLMDSVCPQQGRGSSLSYKEKFWVYRR